MEAWDGEPTFRIRGKNVVFSDPRATHLTIKLSRDEAAAVVATETWVAPAGYTDGGPDCGCVHTCNPGRLDPGPRVAHHG